MAHYLRYRTAQLSVRDPAWSGFVFGFYSRNLFTLRCGAGCGRTQIKSLSRSRTRSVSGRTKAGKLYFGMVQQRVSSPGSGEYITVCYALTL